MKYKRKKEKSFWVLARSYLHDYMPAVRNLSNKSVDAYKQSLKTYLRFLDEKKSISDEKVDFEAFSRDHVKEFIKWLSDAGYSAKTVNLKLTAIRSFLKYCGEEDFELRGIYDGVCQIKKLKEPKKPIEYRQPDATSAIMSDYDTRTSKHRRNRMMLILMYDSGARVQELADMDTTSLHLEDANPYVTLIGKGRKSRNVPIMKKTVEHLKAYLNEFHADGDTKPLFYGNHGGRHCSLSTDSISLILKDAASIARKACDSVPENVHCHLMRKSKAMDLYKNGVPLPFIMQLLGHESMSTTSGFYAFATREMMSEAINKAAPSPNTDEKLWLKEDIKKVIYSLD